MNKIKVGLVGLGKLGYLHASNIAKRIDNATLFAVCDKDEKSLDKAKNLLGVPFIYTDFDEMLTNDELDAVFIASPSAFHFNHIQASMKKNLPIFCEKPLGISLEEVKTIENLVDQSSFKEVFMVGFMRRFDPSYVSAKKKIDEGIIGKPYMIRCYGLDPIKYVKGAVPFAKTSGGLFLDMSIHDIDLARWLMEDEVDTVYAQGGCFVEEGFKQYDDVDNGTVMMRFKNGGMGLFYTSRTCHHGYHIETEIVGTKGSMRVSAIPEKDLVTIFNEQGAVRECMDYFMDRFDDAYLNEVKEFVNAIIEKRQAAVGVKDGVKSTEIAYACKDSMKEDEIVRL